MANRPSAVAGYFYPVEAPELSRDVNALLGPDHKPAPHSKPARPRALIVPHAGYLYSGAIAARAYRILEGQEYSHVLLLGPAHTVALQGLALPNWTGFATPLGISRVDQQRLNLATTTPEADFNDQAHAREHSLEVQLPFLQILLPRCPVMPVIVGATRPEQVCELIEQLLGEDGLLVISSDLSHFHPVNEANELDRSTIQRINSRATDLHGEEACGAYPLNGALLWASRHGLQPHLLAYGTSADASGDTSRVVGYASFELH